MNDADDDKAAPHLIFGVPTVLTYNESSSLISDLTDLWTNCYGREFSDLESDLGGCRHFFDPVARGQSLRTRLAEIHPVTAGVIERIGKYGPPLTIDAGEGVLLVGIEARLLIELFRSCQKDGSHVALPDSAILATERKALEIYRQWTIGRLSQVIALRTGHGKEAMQAVAVGIILALLVNRSTSPERAIIQRDHDTADGKDIDTAIYAGAEAFASILSTGGRGRSTGEQRLKGGYALTEARRRLAHRLSVVATDRPGEKLIFIPASNVDNVIAFLGAELARRQSLTEAKLQKAFENLVTAFRTSAHALVYRSMVFDRKAETIDLQRRLLKSFSEARLEVR